LVCQLALEALCVVAQLLLPHQDVGLALADRLVAGCNAGGLLLQIALALAEPAFALRQLLVPCAPLVLALGEPPLTAVEPGRRGLLARGDFALVARELLLAVGEGALRLFQLGEPLLALAVGALQVAQALL